jgi:hypothetical protein
LFLVLQMTSDIYFKSRGLIAPARVLDSELRFHQTIVSEPIVEGSIVLDPDHRDWVLATGLMGRERHAQYQALYRLRLPDGSLSDLMNLSSARQAARDRGMIKSLKAAAPSPAEKSSRTIQCAQCSTTIERARRLQKFCSDDCKFDYKHQAAA